MATRMPDVGDRVGRYLLTDVLGRGGMGTVYRAEDQSLERTVALKIINPAIAAEPEYRERFRREAVAMSRLDSAHVVMVFDHGEHDGTPYLVTQLVAGGDLDSLVRRAGALPPERALALTDQVLAGLADAHAAGIVHRDIKPSNVLLSTEGDRAFLCDFGIATSPASGLTRTGALMGSVSYMAPERHAGETAASASPAADIYGVGCLLWAMLTGTPPYSGTELEIAMAHLHGPIPRLPGHDPCSGGVNAVLERSLAKDPAHRYGSAGEMRAAIAGLLRGAPAVVALPDATSIRQPLVSTSAPGASGAASEEKRRRLPMALMASLTTIALLLAVAGVILALHRPTMVDALSGDTTARTSDSASPTASPDVPGSPRSTTPARGRKHAKVPDVPAGLAPDQSVVGAGAAGSSGALTPAGGRHRATGSGGTHAGRAGSAATHPAPAPTRAPAAPAAPTSQAAPARPAYRCWNGAYQDKLANCGLPTGSKGANWMWPHRSFHCSSYNIPGTTGDAESWHCSISGANIYMTRWKSHSAGVSRYSSFGKRLSWSCGSYTCGSMWRGTQNGEAVSARLYSAAPYWSVSIRAKNADRRTAAYNALGGSRAPAAIRGVRSS